MTPKQYEQTVGDWVTDLERRHLMVMASLFTNLLLVFYVGLAYTCGTMTYNTRTFKENMKQAFQKAKSGEQVLITRHDETFVLVERNRYLDSLPADTDVTIPAIDPQFRLVLEKEPRILQTSLKDGTPLNIKVTRIDRPLGDKVFKRASEIATTTDKPVINKGASK